VVTGRDGRDRTDLNLVERARFDLKCKICGTKGAAAVQCVYGRCHVSAHPQCVVSTGKQNGFEYRITASKKGEIEGKIYCDKHSKFAPNVDEQNETVEPGLNSTSEHPCDICNNDSISKGNEILFCYNCEIFVHQKCYDEYDLPSGQWLCDACSNDLNPDWVVCAVCLHSGGIMKPTTDGQWVHSFCYKSVRELAHNLITSSSKKNLFGIKASSFVPLNQLEKSRLNRRCALCDDKAYSVQCCYSSERCQVTVHPSCVLSQKESGFYFTPKEVTIKNKKILEFEIFCNNHSGNDYNGTPTGSHMDHDSFTNLSEHMESCRDEYSGCMGKKTSSKNSALHNKKKHADNKKKDDRKNDQVLERFPWKMDKIRANHMLRKRSRNDGKDIMIIDLSDDIEERVASSLTTTDEVDHYDDKNSSNENDKLDCRHESKETHTPTYITSQFDRLVYEFNSKVASNPRDENTIEHCGHCRESISYYPAVKCFECDVVLHIEGDPSNTCWYRHHEDLRNRSRPVRLLPNAILPSGELLRKSCRYG
jgi:hypothetical protein